MLSNEKPKKAVAEVVAAIKITRQTENEGYL